MVQIINAARPIQTTPVEPTWEENHLVFRLPSGQVVVQDGWQYGELFVHATLPGDVDLVVVCHRATRLAVLRVTEVEDAIAGAETLWRECPGAWTYCDDVDKTKIPKHIIDWIRRCNAQKKLLPLA